MAETNTNPPAGMGTPVEMSQDCPSGYQLEQSTGVCYPEKAVVNFDEVDVYGEIVKPSIAFIQEYQPPHFACNEYTGKPFRLRKWKACMSDIYGQPNTNQNHQQAEIKPAMEFNFLEVESNRVTDPERQALDVTQHVFGWSVPPFSGSMGAAILSPNQERIYNTFVYWKWSFHAGQQYYEHKFHLGAKLGVKRLLEGGEQAIGMSLLAGGLTSRPTGQSGAEFGTEMEYLWNVDQNASIGPKFQFMHDTLGDTTMNMGVKIYFD